MNVLTGIPFGLACLAILAYCVFLLVGTLAIERLPEPSSDDEGGWS